MVFLIFFFLYEPLSDRKMSSRSFGVNLYFGNKLVLYLLKTWTTFSRARCIGKVARGHGVAHHYYDDSETNFSILQPTVIFACYIRCTNGRDDRVRQCVVGPRTDFLLRSETNRIRPSKLGPSIVGSWKRLFKGFFSSPPFT